MYAGEDRAAHDTVPDIEFLDLRDRRDGGDVPVGQAVAGVDGEAERPRMSRGGAKLIQGRRIVGPVVGVATGVEFHRGDPERRGLVEHPVVRVEEETDPGAGVHEPCNGVAQGGAVRGEIQSPFGGHLLPAFRYQRGLKRPDGHDGVEDVGSRRQFQVEHGPDGGPEGWDIGVLDVAPILPQVGGDPIRAAPFTEGRRAHGVGFVGAPRLAQRRDVINVHVQANGLHWQGSTADICSRCAHTDLKDTLMRSGIVLLVGLAGACGGAQASGPPGVPAPAPTAAAAVTDFMQAVADSNLTAMADLWGTERGSALQTGQPRDYQRRVIIMQSYLRGGTGRIVSEVDTPEGRKLITLELSRGRGCTKLVPFTVIRQGKRWLISAIELDAAGVPGKPCGVVPTKP